MRRRLLLNLLPRPLLILWAQSDLVLVHCPSINRDNPEGETNKQAEAACVEVWMQGVVWSCIASRVWCTICQSTQRSFRDASEKCRVQYAGSYSDRHQKQLRPHFVISEAHSTQLALQTTNLEETSVATFQRDFENEKTPELTMRPIPYLPPILVLVVHHFPPTLHHLPRPTSPLHIQVGILCAQYGS